MTVVDASLWISFLLPDDVNHHESRTWFERLPPTDRIFAPTLLFVEIAAGLARRTGRLDIVEQAIAVVKADPRLTVWSMDDDLMERAVQLAATLRLRAGDAIYVTLAAVTGTRLVTWDREQRERSAPLIAVSSPDEDVHDN